MFLIKKSNSKTFNEDVDLAVNYLRSGRIIIYPADTCYGIGGLLTSKSAQEKIKQYKSSSKSKYYSVIVPGLKWIYQNMEVNAYQKNILEKYLPGEYTFVLKLHGEEKTLGIRIPQDNFINRVSMKVNRPFTSTSANITQQATPYSLDDLKKGILSQPDITNEDILVLDAGKLDTNKISTVVDLTKKKPVIIRQGSGKFLT